MMEQHIPYSHKLNVWARVIAQHIVGTSFINGTVTAIIYLNLLHDDILPDIVNLFSDGDRRGMSNYNIWFQQEGVMLHFS